MQVLRVTRKDGHAWTVPIEPDRINIGRDRHNELVLEDEAVSRKHALIEREGHAIGVCQKFCVCGDPAGFRGAVGPQNVGLQETVWVASRGCRSSFPQWNRIA